MEKQRNLIIGSVVALIAVIFVVLNTSPDFGFFKVRLPLIVVLVVMVIIGMIIAWFFGRDSQEHKAQNKVAFLNKNKKKTE